jgi:hypothetical protein
MKFIVRYKCQNCGEILEDKLTIHYQLGHEDFNIPDELAKESEKTIIHPCCYREWGVAKPYGFRLSWSDDE